jgi:hypothetical protein
VNFGLWFTGSSSSRFASFALAQVSGSVPPTNQKTDGTCSDPNDRKSSLAGAGPASRTGQSVGCGSRPLVGDCGMITQAHIEEDIQPARLNEITALRAPQIRALVDSRIFQLSPFDECDLASITARSSMAVPRCQSRSCRQPPQVAAITAQNLIQGASPTTMLLPDARLPDLTT